MITALSLLLLFAALSLLLGKAGDLYEQRRRRAIQRRLRAISQGKRS